MQKKGCAWDETSSFEDVAMQVEVSVSLEKKGVVPGQEENWRSTGQGQVTNRNHRATNVNRGMIRGTGRSMESGGNGSRFHLLPTDMEEVELGDPMNMNLMNETTEEEALNHGVVVGASSGSSANGIEVSGVSTS
ncbi:hypothetical protein V6N13_051117 [Hibiscus sabdariffa]|uniref:Uncharacterized protein n=1 Tax=Hibiscus sabdariffa TaxID=183260 RepID=A0ABR2T2N4_9ROSI